jgi:DNA helicase II / ATP-dependent DNA helicase PcrA
MNARAEEAPASPSHVPPEIVAALGGRPPTPEQWRAISMPLEPCVVVAGAGSGKTSVMAARLVYLALVAFGLIDGDHDGAHPGNVLCLTFTNKATENLALRVRMALSTVVDLPEGEEPVVMNYHAFAAQVLDRHGLRIGLEPGRRILTNAQREDVAGRVLDRMTFQHVAAEWQPTVVEAILKLADQAANHLVEPEEIIAFNEERLSVLRGLKSRAVAEAAEKRIELARAVRVFEDIKVELGVYDFGDQIRGALQIAERFPEVVRDYRERFQAVLLDEYQDTNVAQGRLLERVFGDGFPVTAVGDPDQNIYAWRGASLFNLLRFPEQFPTAEGRDATRLPLYTNFRSGARILATADRTLEPLPANQRPDAEKRLMPWPANGRGEVALARLEDEWTEACWIAEHAATLHASGESWGTMAVLCRKSRLFTPLQQAFAERGIPVEIIGLAGLLKVPAVQEVLAYARAAADPDASISLARILLGPRYRVGYKDLALVAGWASTQNRARRTELDEDESGAFLLAEALEHLDEIEGLSTEARSRLEEFDAELREIRVQARRPVGEFLADVMRRIGLLAELDANLDREPAAATARNLAAFLDEVHAFTPLEGDLTLDAFLQYADVVERDERQEWSPVQPTEEDSVKVMTIHQAKGLEFDTVFVPGVAHELLPDMKIQHNPAERGYSLDFELRGDHDVLPRFDGVLKTFKEDLRRQEEYEERRTFYVALTRARRRLFVSAAHWYGEGATPKDRSILFEELASWAVETGDASVDRGPDRPDRDADNPLLGYRERFVRPWPGPATRSQPDAVFPTGWRRAAADSGRAGAVQPSLLESLTADDAVAYAVEGRGRRLEAADLLERERVGPTPTPIPTSLSVTGVIEYARCPKRFYWSAVRPLPRFSGPAARVGTQVHRWIELRSRGQASLLEDDDVPDLTAEELAGGTGTVDRLRRTFQDSRFAGEVPLFAERPFLLRLGDFMVGGRIDAIYPLADGRWEVVDYKTGRVPSTADAIANLQLDLYALACVDIWGKRPDDLLLTYLYLSTGDVVTHGVDNVGDVRARILRSLGELASGRFEPTPGPQCHWCDFLPFCPAGRAFVDAVEHAR